MGVVFLVWHEHSPGDDDENTKLLGVYSTEQRAAARLAGRREVLSGAGVWSLTDIAAPLTR